MQAQTGRAQRPILNRLTLGFGLAVLLATIVVAGLAALEIDLPFTDDGESSTVSQSESRIPATAKTAWDYGDVEADLQTSAGPSAAAPNDRLAIPHRPGLTSGNRGDHRAANFEMGGVLYLDEVTPAHDKSATDTSNHRSYDLTPAEAQVSGLALDMTEPYGTRFMEQNIQLPDGTLVEPAQSVERLRFLEQNVWEYADAPATYQRLDKDDGGSGGNQSRLY